MNPFRLPHGRWGWASFGVRAGLSAMALGRLVRVATASPPLRRATTDAEFSVSVVVPARDEEQRIRPLLDAIVAAPDVAEVIVVDDESSDDTAQVARDAGARVVLGAPLPDGWAGKSWAVQQGVEAASGDWVVTFDADTTPEPSVPHDAVARAEADGWDFLTVAGRFECPTRPTRWLHAAMLTTLVYRHGPPGSSGDAERMIASGQCMVFRRQEFLDAGAMSLVAGEVVEDIALVRRLAGLGWKVGFLDASDLLSVRMFESAFDTWTGWGRSLALPGVETAPRQVAGLAVVVVAQALPLLRIVARRGDVVDLVMLMNRLGTLVGTRRVYDRNDLAYWASPLADLAAAVAIAGGILRRGRQTWRGRTYT